LPDGKKVDVNSWNSIGHVNFADVPGSIAQLPDVRVETFLFDCLERRFGVAVLRTADYSFNLTLPVGYRVLTPTVWIENEVDNGGIAQYFWNRFQDYRLMIPDALLAYEKMGAPELAAGLRECLRVFEPLEPECGRLKNQEKAHMRGKSAPPSGSFHEWNHKWDEQHCEGDLPLMCERISDLYRIPWIRKNPEAFVFPANDPS